MAWREKNDRRATGERLARAWTWGAEHLAQPAPRFALGTRDDMERLTTDGIPESCAMTAHDYAHLAAMPDAAIAIAPTGLIAEVNPMAETLVGYTRDELIARPITKLFDNLDVANLRTEVRFIPAGTGTSLLHRNGRTIAADILLCPDTRGAVLAVLRRVPEDERRFMCEEDVAQIVHDMKNPLSTIALEMSVLHATAEKIDAYAIERSVARITSNLEFVDRLIQDLLDLCAIDCDAFAIRRSPQELRALIERVVERAVPTRDASRVYIEAHEAVAVEIDALRIERVVANLVCNALKYSPRDAAIVVRLEMGADRACVSVIDAGPGIDEAERDYIFDKFRRAKNASGLDGCGLGLYVSKRIVEAHGGTIGVDSNAGVGSRFYFELPLRLERA